MMRSEQATREELMRSRYDYRAILSMKLPAVTAEKRRTREMSIMPENRRNNVHVAGALLEGSPSHQNVGGVISDERAHSLP